MGIEQCVDKVQPKEAKDKVWMIVAEGCADCPYVGVTKIYYCRSKRVVREYFAKQLELFPNGKDGELQDD